MSKGLEMLEILKQRNDTLKINHKIGSRDIANQEIKEITQCFDNYVIPVIEKDLDRLEELEKENKLLKKDLKEYQEYIKKGVEEHYKDFMSDYNELEKECEELNKANKKLKNKLEILEELKLENEQLKKELEKYTHKEECVYVIKNTIGYISFFIDSKSTIVACYKTLEEAEKSVDHIAKTFNVSPRLYVIDYIPVSQLKNWEYDTRYEKELLENE